MLAVVMAVLYLCRIFFFKLPAFKSENLNRKYSLAFLKLND